ncbi:DUF2508 family protein [Desulfuribacillus alkaliarsenatis]|uniref:DUF2508 domain-containing protein n=1 Tax=Desulfuribacillus alkaliarsenatis TaxID=766136 RepID=A0A1E5FZ58_9FIRM|nr:DUF2508 family protein [Desulfuribacillus alkaliarsenatis]OEF95727.1 hypothetical protein BHF68_11555 [Desulfuribacillus alkaliarsenatis]
MDNQVEGAKDELYKQLKEVREEWKLACNQFEYATNNKMIDTIIGRMNRAEQQYAKILRALENERINKS